MKKGIEVKELTMRFGNITALDRVDLILEENRIYGLLGRNGAGKTTTMKMLLLPVSASADPVCA